MKKNRIMRVASRIMIATLISTAMVSGTFAKYVSSAAANDSARIAKWGVEITAESGLFGTVYSTKGGISASFQAGRDTVKSNDDTNVIAPGTAGTMVGFTMSGVPEVGVKLSYESTFSIGSGWTVNNQYYCPLIITVGKTTIDGTQFSSSTEFEAAVNNAIVSSNYVFNAGTDLSQRNDETLSISWKWPFEVDDEKDTILGNKTESPTVSLEVTAKLTQVD